MSNNLITESKSSISFLKRLNNKNKNNTGLTKNNNSSSKRSTLNMLAQPAPPDKSLNQIDSNNNHLILSSGSSSTTHSSSPSSSCSAINASSNSTSTTTQIPTVSSTSSSVTSLSSDSSSCQQQLNKKLNKENLAKNLVLTTPAVVSPPQPNTHLSKSIKYGELILLGHNGCINPANSIQSKINCSSSRRRSKFVLKMRDKPNGVKPCSQHSCQTNQEVNNLVLKNENHSVTYTLSRHHTVVVQYTRDEKTDMFQIGRSTESAIDFIVLDTVVPNLQQIMNKSSSSSSQSSQSSSKLSKSATSNMCDSNSNLQINAQSTISRFSCRILVDREYPYTARIYAAGFDSSKRIFLGEKATKWKNEKGELDGVTTNGVLIMHPKTGFNLEENFSSDNTQPEWMEVSVGGAVFSLNESRLSPNFNLNNLKHDPTGMRSNILRDGTLIDLCGATLLWRSIDSLKQTPTKHYLEMNLEHLNRLKPQCPVGFKTLVFPSSASPSVDSQSNRFSNLIVCNKSNSKNMERTPMVYLKCGHVHGHHNWGIKNDNERECPLCRKIGPYVQLLIGLEPSFYCDKLMYHGDEKACNPVNVFKPYAFLPCGHMASEETCKYWSKMLMPQGVTQGLWSICPFCAVPLCKEQPYVKLIFQEGL